MPPRSLRAFVAQHGVRRTITALGYGLWMMWRTRHELWTMFTNQEEARRLKQERIECPDCTVACGPEGEMCDEHEAAFEEFLYGD